MIYKTQDYYFFKEIGTIDNASQMSAHEKNKFWKAYYSN